MIVAVGVPRWVKVPKKGKGSARLPDLATNATLVPRIWRCLISSAECDSLHRRPRWTVASALGGNKSRENINTTVGITHKYK